MLELCLSHSSATEEKLIGEKPGNSKIEVSKEKSKNDSKTENQFEREQTKYEFLENDTILHHMNLASSEKAKSINVKIRELPIARADNPFGSDDHPEYDTTGMYIRMSYHFPTFIKSIIKRLLTIGHAIWPASIILARWIARITEVKAEMINGKNVIELGAGCGLPALTAAIAGSPSNVYVTDINANSIKNSIFNMHLNSKECESTAKDLPFEASYRCSNVNKDGETFDENVTDISTKVFCISVNWLDKSTFPKHKADLLIGSDL